MAARIGKRLVAGLETTGKEYFIWDEDFPGFGVRVRTMGAKSYVFQYRAGAGRSAPTRRITIGSTGRLSPDQARKIASSLSGDVKHDRDPAHERAAERKALTVTALAEEFLENHVKALCKPTTCRDYGFILRGQVIPELGTTRATRLKRQDVARLHHAMRQAPHQANRMLRIVSSMYSFGALRGHVPEGYNPANGVAAFDSRGRERLMSSDELERIGAAIRLGETEGLPWALDPGTPKSKHLPINDLTRRTMIEIHSAAALRLLLFTGCRMREILHLEWSQVDFERGLLFLPDSKTGRKTVILNGPALKVLQDTPRWGRFVIAGEKPDRPRHDLKRPWRAVLRHAGIDDLRIHDLRHNFASFGAGGGLGLPIIGRLLGHSQPATTARYAHLDTDPLRRASNKIAGTIAAALEGKTSSGNVVKLAKKGK